MSIGMQVYFKIVIVATVVLLVFVVGEMICAVGYYVFCKQALPLVGKTADTCIVLFNDFESDKPDRETERRMNYAVKLVKVGAVDSMICVGGARPSRNLYGAELARTYAVEKGVDPEQAYSERVSNDTTSNMREAFRIMTENGMTSAVVISSPVHLFRTRRWVQAPEGFDISYVPYGDEATPELTLRERIEMVHYEWLAFAARAVLPVDKYSNLLDGIRK